MERANLGAQEPRELADLFCRQARLRVNAAFTAVGWNTDLADTKVARNALDGGYKWIEKDIILNDGAGFMGAKADSKPAGKERRRYPV